MALVRAALIALGLTLTFWNCYLLTLCFAMMPKNDFGRPLWGTIAFLRGQACMQPTSRFTAPSTKWASKP